MLNKFYLTCGSLLLVAYGIMAFNGWEFGDPARHVVPASEMHGSGGHGGGTFWHSSGFRGGK